ncbi:hypothetical protein PGT21_001086 [Puccinia graminis f. sp. tritici]|uniref:Uncharacterized protein n=1 Tax=Puccinia graminis f. sp. tritici TaxID=56615 RepID=A0A5B0SF36_PUCGR|nr:hypothetical protein PGT21_001086 [Puccinia graminis f. sp. tritici]KAA1135084.1 hypothetical protein PGTUg99_004406 [Puccinia graminis f. sp. tritici]
MSPHRNTMLLNLVLFVIAIASCVGDHAQLCPCCKKTNGIHYEPHELGLPPQDRCGCALIMTNKTCANIVNKAYYVCGDSKCGAIFRINPGWASRIETGRPCKHPVKELLVPGRCKAGQSVPGPSEPGPSEPGPSEPDSLKPHREPHLYNFFPLS